MSPAGQTTMIELASPVWGPTASSTSVALIGIVLTTIARPGGACTASAVSPVAAITRRMSSTIAPPMSAIARAVSRTSQTASVSAIATMQSTITTTAPTASSTSFGSARRRPDMARHRLNGAAAAHHPIGMTRRRAAPVPRRVAGRSRARGDPPRLDRGGAPARPRRPLSSRRGNLKSTRCRPTARLPHGDRGPARPGDEHDGAPNAPTPEPAATPDSARADRCQSRAAQRHHRLSAHGRSVRYPRRIGAAVSGMARLASAEQDQASQRKECS